MNFKALSFLLVALFLSSCATDRQYCEMKNISGLMSEKERAALRSFGPDWLGGAMVCTMGEFEVATPPGAEDADSNTVLVYRNGKPVFYRSNNGTLVFSPKPADASFEKILVRIWHGGEDEDIERIRYQTLGRDPEVMSYDTDFDGQADVKTVYEGGRIVEIYSWEENAWKPKR